MRMRGIMATAFLALLAVACSDQGLDEISKYRVQVTASVGEQVRTTITDDADARRAVVTWADGDRIGIVAMTNGAISALDLSSGAGSRVATFDGEVATQDAVMEDYFAFYPKQDEASVVEGRLSMSLPLEQRNAASGIDGATCGFMVAKCADAAVDALAFGFENLFAVVKISLTGGGEQLARICVTGGAGEQMSGNFMVDMTDEEPTVEFADGASARVYLLSDKVLSDEPIALYIVVPAVEYAAGYSVRVTASDGRTMVRTVGRNGGRTLQRGVLYNLPTLAFEGAHTDLSVGGAANCYVVSEAGSYCFDCGVSGGAKAELLWEDNEGLISDVGLASDGYVCFKASEQRGNALLVLRDASERIIGSWHIWATEKPKVQRYADGTLALDRNLGAMSPTAVGLYYQWGRRTPFVSKPQTAKAANLLEATANPDLFMTNWSSFAPNDSWGNPSTAAYSSQLGAKAVDDPCPAGWRVAQPSFFRTIIGSLKEGDSGCYEMMLEDGVAYYPITDRLTTSGALSGSAICNLWTNSNYVNSTSATLYGTYVQLSKSNISSFEGSGKRINLNKTYGLNVRCVAE